MLYPRCLIFATLTGLFAFASCNRQTVTTAAATAVPAPVRAAAIRVEPRPFAITIGITGTLVSRSRVDVKAETLGKIVKFPKQEGDSVEAGEAVVWVDDSDERLAVHELETAIEVATASVERAKIGEGHAHAEWIRAQNLLQSGGITDRDYKAAELSERDARAQVTLAVAQLERGRAQLERARKLLADSIVRAPVSGEIQTRYINEGAYVEAVTPVFAIVDNRRLELESMVASAEIGAVRAGQPVTFAVNAFPGQKFSGSVVDVNPVVHAETRSAKVRIRVDNSGMRLKAGMFAEGELLTGVHSQAIAIPSSAAYRDDRNSQECTVFVVVNGQAARRKIRIGRESDSSLEAVTGLRPGDIVLTGQSIEIAEGVRVEPQFAKGPGT